ncbi:MAG: two-component regulator propeller domain-containing protein [Nitrospirota bacterium]
MAAAALGLLALVIVGCDRGSPPSRPLELKQIPAQGTEYVAYSSFDTGPGTYVRALKLDGRVLWVGTSRGIVAVDHASGNLLQTYTRASVGNRMASDYIFTINVGSGGVKWFGTNNGGLVQFNPSAEPARQWTNYLPAHGLADFWIYDIDFQADGTMWVGTWDGVSRYDGTAPEGKRFTNYNEKDGLANRWVYAVAVDRDQSLWFGTEAGVSRFDPSAPSGGQWRTWRHEDGLGAPNALALKRSENTGMGTITSDKDYPTRHDLSVLDDSGNETYNENYVFSLAVDRDGAKWIGTWGGGLSRFDGGSAPGQWRNYTTKEGLAGNIVYAVEIDDRGILWLGTNHGLSRFDPGAPADRQWRKWTIADGLLGEDVYAIAPAGNGTIWLGQKGGVVELRPEQGPQHFEG